MDNVEMYISKNTFQAQTLQRITIIQKKYKNPKTKTQPKPNQKIPLKNVNKKQQQTKT
jgi:hypothetical protein